MGKIADALKKAGFEKDVPPQRDTKPPPEVKETAPKARIEHKNHDTSSVRSEPGQGFISPKLVVYHKPDSMAAEHFKVLRSQILYPRDGVERRVILVTSAIEQEGKTFVACNLAVSISQGIDPYALLIDADTRLPSVHTFLGINAQEGLSDYLQKDQPLSRFLVKTPLTKLTILPGGNPPRNPAELLTSSKMTMLLEEARERYSDRFIILDSPPVNLAAETLTLSKLADAVIFVVRYGKSNRDIVEQAVEKIGREKILGVVFNGFEVTPRKYAYYKDRYRYYSR